MPPNKKGTSHNYEITAIKEIKQGATYGEVAVESPKRRLVDAFAIAKNVNKLMNYLNPIISNIDNVKEVIKPNVKYVVQISKEILDKIDRGELDFMKSGGETIANIVDKTRPKKPIVKQLRITKEAIANPQAKAVVGHMAQNIAIQQQLASITERLDAIADKAERILIGQMTDRLGFIYGSWDTYQQALYICNEELRNALKLDIIQSLNIGRQQLLQYISSLDKFFDELPVSEFETAFRNLNGKLKKDCVDTLNSCNQALTGIALSTVLLSNIYLSYDETGVLEVLTTPLIKVIETRRANILHIANIASQHDKLFDWVINPSELENFLDEIKNPVKMLKGDILEIEMSGAELIKLREEKLE
ncbi:MAG: hypothetical protein APF81_22185 [Desulfosporosinus sp. BRH_c37]|nr:MAG: hypothetical protein APF81_22185 [Desulfosporosinus sp. BRH_c37]